MRRELFWNPLLLAERIGQLATDRMRLNKLKGTIAHGLSTGHIDSLELLELVRDKVDVKVIYDIGANVGTWTTLSKALFPQAEVHAFEPLVRHVRAFQASTAGLANVQLHQVALGSENRSGLMNVTDFTDASSLLHLAPLGAQQWSIHEAEREAVAIEKLDDFIARNRVASPDLIKLDIQGYELEALRGGSATIMTARAILLEISFKTFYVGQCLFSDVMEFLARSQFRLAALGSGARPGQELVQLDALFLNDGPMQAPPDRSPSKDAGGAHEASRVRP